MRPSLGSLTLLMLLLGVVPARAVEVAGVDLPPEVRVQGEALQLNGYGIRTKFFFKVYVGSLYTLRPVATTEAALAVPGAKLIRMDFLYRKVEKEKIVGGFEVGFANNAPALQGTEAAARFLALFDSDFVAGDRVDLEITADESVTAIHNGRRLGTVNSDELARGVLLIYLGDEPADKDMKAGMLGN